MPCRPPLDGLVWLWKTSRAGAGLAASGGESTRDGKRQPPRTGPERRDTGAAPPEHPVVPLRPARVPGRAGALLNSAPTRTYRPGGVVSCSDGGGPSRLTAPGGVRLAPGVGRTVTGVACPAPGRATEAGRRPDDHGKAANARPEAKANRIQRVLQRVLHRVLHAGARPDRQGIKQANIPRTQWALTRMPPCMLQSIHTFPGER